MINFRCPVCGDELTEYEKVYKCEKNHSFDRSRFGYVNLLMSNRSSSARHGDDRLMVRARRDFLDKGYYSFLRDELIKTCGEYIPQGGRILDCGCGECYYSSGIFESGNYEFSGIDISKDALEFAHKRGVLFPLAVASAFSLPFADGSFDGILNVFSPLSPGEYARVLKHGGVLISVVPLEKHLYSLKEKIYDEAYLNDTPEKSVDGFKLLKSTELSKTVFIDNADDIRNLFKMTPYYYKTSREGQARADALGELETSADFCVMIFEKN